MRRLLELHPGGVSEYELIRELQAAGCFAGWVSDDATLALFQKHFSVMHCLYRLRDAYAEQGRELHISPLRVQLVSARAQNPGGRQLSLGGEAVAGFYLDWANYEAATPETVASLLKQFWQRYAAVDQTTLALEVLELKAGAPWADVQKQYRRLAAEHHPDKGGERDRFTQVREAYETLKKVYT